MNPVSALIFIVFVGGAALTPLMGVVPGVALAYLVPAVCFVGVAIYAWFLSSPEPEEIAAGAA